MKTKTDVRTLVNVADSTEEGGTRLKHAKQWVEQPRNDRATGGNRLRIGPNQAPVAWPYCLRSSVFSTLPR